MALPGTHLKPIGTEFGRLDRPMSGCPAVFRWEPVATRSFPQRESTSRLHWSGLLVPSLGPLRRDLAADDEQRRQDVEHVGIALGFWVLVMLVIVQWA
jgi:hypothetical protein